MLTRPESDRPDADRAASQPSPARFGWLPRRWLAAALLVALGVLLFAAYLAQARTVAASSDSAGQALQAWDMLHGNVLLHGWWLSDVSFYTTELPEYMLVELARGLNGDVVHVAAALSYTLAVLLAALLAKGRATGQEGLVRLLVAVGIMLAPTLQQGTYLLLSGPDHTGTQVPLLVIWLVLDRAPARWWVPVVVAVLLTWAQVADMIVLVEGVLPLVLVCLLRLARRRGPLAGQWYELSLAIGALASVVAARLALAAIRQAGGFFVGIPRAHISITAGLSAVRRNTEGVLGIFGANFSGPTFPFAVAVAVLHLFGVAAVAWAAAVVLRRIFTEADLIAQVLTVAFIALLAAWMLGARPDANEIVGLLPIGAALVGRVLVGRLTRASLVLPLAAVLACFASALIYNADQPARVSQNVTVSWLEAHHLSYGLAGYWQASIMTVDSGGRVQIRPVRMFRHELVTTPEESDASWYDPRQHDANFVLWAPRGCLGVCLSIADLRRTFGPPAVIYRVAGYRVLVWRKNLLTDLPTLWFCGRGFAWAAQARPSLVPCPQELLQI